MIQIGDGGGQGAGSDFFDVAATVGVLAMAGKPDQQATKEGCFHIGHVMPRRFIFDVNVVGRSFNSSAAPPRPETFPFAFLRAATMCCRSISTYDFISGSTAGINSFSGISNASMRFERACK